jgi:ORF6N domain
MRQESIKRQHRRVGDLVAVAVIERRIYLIRTQKVMIDSDLAELYQVPTKSLNLAVRRNSMRFPADFMFQLSQAEADSLRFQTETSKTGRGGRRYLPSAFTEQGIAMLSSVLNSDRAVLVNIAIMRAFVKLVFDAIKKLLQPPVSPKRSVGSVCATRLLTCAAP